MKAHTERFKEEISTYGRQLDNKITYSQYGENKNVTDLLGANVITNTDLLKTVMKEFDFDSKQKIDKDILVNYQFGVKINDDYEYLDYGNFIVVENDWNADTNSFKHICYDKMLYTMVEYDGSGISYPITVRNYISRIATKCGLVFANSNDTFVNYDKTIKQDHFSNGNYTFRDVLDYLCEIIAGCLVINENGELAIKYPTETNEVFNADFLRDTNITFKSKYGAVNSIVFSRGAGSDNIYRKDDNDINTNGLHELRFDNNPFLEGTDREEFIDGVYNELHGLEFYVMDVTSTGIAFLEVGDFYTFEITEAQAIKSGLVKAGLFKAQNNNSGSIKCLLLNDEMDLSSGLNEIIYADEPSSSVTNYKTSSPTDNSIKNAIITTDKNAGEIVLKANSDGKIVQVELKGNADNGSVFNVDADNINLTANDIINLIAGNSINLTAKNISINSTNFNVDKDGNTTITSGSIQSNNYVANTRGTKINLTDGVIDTKNFKVDSTGNATMNNAILTGGEIKSSNYVTNTSGTKINLSTGAIDSKNFKVDNQGNTICNNLNINGGKILINQNFTEQNPYIDIEHPNSTELAPISTMLWGDGISCINYQGTPSIRTENGNGYAELSGHVVNAFGFNNISLAEKKKDFELLQSGLDIINNIDIYKYRYKNEINEKKHIGLVIGDNYKYSKEVTTDDNKEVELYSFIAVCCKAIQELEEKIKRLESEK